MKIEEISVGSYVRTNKGEIIKVEVITSKRKHRKVGYHHQNEALPQMHYVRIAQCEPIEITPEILKLNGWVVDGYSILRLEDGHHLEYYHYEQRLRRWWEGIDEWQNHAKVKEIVFQCHCRYVHELQIALRLMYLYDLANNFVCIPSPSDTIV